MTKQQQKTLSIIIALISSLIFWFVSNKTPSTAPKPNKKTENTSPKPANNNNNTDVNPNNNNNKDKNAHQSNEKIEEKSSILKEIQNTPIIYTDHAHCRMDCRHIDEGEIKEILQAGVINDRKSDAHASPCPTYAIEGKTSDNQQVRIVVAHCETKNKIITVIDLEHDYKCNCY